MKKKKTVCGIDFAALKKALERSANPDIDTESRDYVPSRVKRVQMAPGALKSLRKHLGITQVVLAARMEVTHPCISQVETHPAPRITLLTKVRNALRAIVNDRATWSTRAQQDLALIDSFFRSLLEPDATFLISSPHKKMLDEGVNTDSFLDPQESKDEV